MPTEKLFYKRSRDNRAIANPNRDLAQTLRWSRDPAKPYPCDGIFVPAYWYQDLETCKVLSSPD